MPNRRGGLNKRTEVAFFKFCCKRGSQIKGGAGIRDIFYRSVDPSYPDFGSTTYCQTHIKETKAEEIYFLNIIV